MSGSNGRTMQRETVMTGVVRLSYCHIGDGWKSEDRAAPDFGATLILEDADAAAIYAAINRVADAAFSDQRMSGSQKLANRMDGLISPLHHGSEKPDRPELQGKYYTAAKARENPICVGGDGVSQIAPSTFYSGCYAMAQVNVSEYAYTQNGRVMSRGISIYLNAVQFVRDGEALSSGGKPSFASAVQAFGGRPAPGYQPPMGQPQYPPQQQPYQPQPGYQPGYQSGPGPAQQQFQPQSPQPQQFHPQPGYQMPPPGASGGQGGMLAQGARAPQGAWNQPPQQGFNPPLPPPGGGPRPGFPPPVGPSPQPGYQAPPPPSNGYAPPPGGQPSAPQIPAPPLYAGYQPPPR